MNPPTSSPTSRLVTFAAGNAGPWRIREIRPVIGPTLESAPCLAVLASDDAPPGATWQLRGITSNERYVTRAEKTALQSVSPPLGRGDAVCGALIPIRKNAAWWALTQDERRAIFEDRSQHIQIGLRSLPAVARRLHHCRDLGPDEPFDFLTWFEFAPADEPQFDALLGALRGTEEWRYVEREVEVRLDLAPV
jgi:hypothetical protein